MKIKNWREFQHYKHRDPPWIRLYRRLLNDREWHNLSGEAAKTLINLWLIASEGEGDLPSNADLAFRLRIKEKDFSIIISQLSHWLERDASKLLAECKQVATTETETETETETDKTLVRSQEATRPKTSEAFEQFWKAYPRRLGANPKAPAAKIFEVALKQGANPLAIIEGARRCAVADADKIGTPYIPQAVKWLRDRRWEDYSAESQPTEGLMSEAERDRLFAELRKPLKQGNSNGRGPEPQGNNLPRSGVGSREGEEEGKAKGRPPPIH